jgi:glycosyl hydrolase family 123
MQFSNKKMSKIKFSLFMINFAHLVSMIFIYTAMEPFRHDYKSEYAFSTGLYVAILVPFAIFMFLGSIWNYKQRRKMLVQTICLAFLLVTNTIMIFDMANYTEWVGSPSIVVFGQYWLYSYYTPTINFIAIIVVALSGITDIEQMNKRKVRNNLNFGAIILFAVIWGEMWIFINKGPFFLFWIQNIFVIGYFIIVLGEMLVRLGQIPTDKLDLIEKSNENETLSNSKKKEETNNNLNSKGTISFNSKNLMNGVLALLKFVGFGIPIIACLLLSSIIWHMILVSPNFIPLIITNMPILIIGALFWVVVYLITHKRFIILIGSLVSLLFALILLNLDPYAIKIYEVQILWFIGIAIAGLWFSIFTHLPEMNTGKFSRNFWSISLFIMGIFGFGYGFLVGVDNYPLELYTTALPLIIGIIIYFIVIKTVVIFKKRNLSRLLNTELEDDSTEAQEENVKNNNDSGTIKIPKKKLKERSKNFHLSKKELKTSVIAISLILMFIVPIPIWSYAVGVENNKEQILGTPNGDYYLWYADSLRTIDRNYEPSFNSSTIDNTVKVSLARGEYEGFQVIFSPGKIKKLNVWSFKPKGNLIHTVSGSEIGSGNISVQTMSYIENLGYQYPDDLAPFKRFDTSATSDQKNWPFYITVFIPNDKSLEAGTYEVQMEFYCKDFHQSPDDHSYNHRRVDFNIEVEVYNFSISKERHLGMEIIWGIEDNEKWVDFYGEYRLDASYPRVPIINYSSTPGNLYININWTKWESDLAACFENGMSYFPIKLRIPGVTWGDTPSFTPQFQILLEWYIGNMSTHFASFKSPSNTSYLDHAYYFITDEPPLEHYSQIMTIAKIIHAINPNIRIMETMNQPLDTYPDEFLEHIDIYCQYIHHWEPSKTYPSSEPIDVEGWPKRLKEYVETYNGSREKELWVYLTHNRHPTPDTEIFQPGILHRNSFWLFWTYKIDGWLYWSFNWGVDMTEGYGWAGYGEARLVGYDYNDDPTSTLRLERVRDGVEDFEYFWLLNKTCEILHSKGMTVDEARGKALLAKVDQMFNHPEYLEDNPGYDTVKGFEGKNDAYLWGHEYESEQYITIRNEIGDELNRIYSMGVI